MGVSMAYLITSSIFANGGVMRSLVLDFKNSEFIRCYLKYRVNVNKLRIMAVGSRFP